MGYHGVPETQAVLPTNSLLPIVVYLLPLPIVVYKFKVSPFTNRIFIIQSIFEASVNKPRLDGVRTKGLLVTRVRKKAKQSCRGPRGPLGSPTHQLGMFARANTKGVHHMLRVVQNSSVEMT